MLSAPVMALCCIMLLVPMTLVSLLPFTVTCFLSFVGHCWFHASNASCATINHTWCSSVQFSELPSHFFKLALNICQTPACALCVCR